MPDITMCTGKGCAVKDRCYRYTAKPSRYGQSYFSTPPVEADGTCDYFWVTRMFKVGDKVRCVQGYQDQITPGGIYTVIKDCEPIHRYVHIEGAKVNGGSGAYAVSRFVLATESATPAPATGPTDATGTFVKHDQGKSRVDLIPSAFLEELGHVLRLGAEKYDEDNWARGANWRRYIGAGLRHLYAFGRGEDRDPESGYSHLAHAGACLCFLFEYARCGLGKDDRWKGGSPRADIHRP